MNPLTPSPLNCAAAGPVSALEHSALREWFASLGAVGARCVARWPVTQDAAAVVDISAPSEQPALSPSPVALDDDPSPTPAA